MTKDPKQVAVPVAELVKFMGNANVRTEQLLAAKSHHGKVVVVGKFVSSLVDKEVSILVKDRTDRATLRMIHCGGNQKRYYFEVVWDGDPNGATATDQEMPTPAATAKTVGRPKVTINKAAGRPKESAAAKKPVRKAEVKNRAATATPLGLPQVSRHHGIGWPVNINDHR